MLQTIYYQTEKEVFEQLITSRQNETDTNVVKTVEAMITDIRVNRDEALLRYAKQLDGFDSETIQVSQAEIEAACSRIDERFMEILKRAQKQITEFHRHQIENSWMIHKPNGVVMGQMVNGLNRVALYVPGGTASYPSSVLMNAIPARLAGVKEIVILTPVNADNKVQDEILAAAFVAGVDTIYKVGGAHGVIAASLGTKQIPKVDKIVGPGNIYVATAKKMMFGTVDIDMIAGPSEVTVIADQNANPAYIAADLMAQAEHDVLAQSILITPSKSLVAAVNEELEKQIQLLSRKAYIAESLQNLGAAIIVENIDEAIAVSNQIAPEHLEILVENPMTYLPRIVNAGSIFLGSYTPEILGDYMGGPNHVLPTNGSAKFYSPLGVYDFVKRSSYSYYPKAVLETFKDDVIEFANREGLDGHAHSMNIRFQEEE